MAQSTSTAAGAASSRTAATAGRIIDLPGWAYGLIALLVALTYYFYSTFSNGFYQHDEIAHFMNMQNFWVDPGVIMSVWAKPGYKILLVLPALGGAGVVAFVHCLFAALAAWLAALTAREYGLRNPVISLILTAFQPILYAVAFRNYSEMLTAACIAGLLLSYARERWIWAALLSSYLFLLRQELALISIALGAIYVWRAVSANKAGDSAGMRRFAVAFLVLGAAPVLLNLVGWMYTASDPELEAKPLYLLDMMFGSGAPGEYNQLGFFHFWRMFTPAIGAVTTMFFLFGYFGFVVADGGWRAHLSRFHLPYLVFTIYFLSICLFTDKAFTFLKLTGNLRQLVVVAPIIGLFANIGFDLVYDNRAKTKAFLVGCGLLYLLIVATVLSFAYDHLNFTEVQDYSRAATTAIALAGLAAVLYLRLNPRWLVALVAVLAIGHTVLSEKPKTLSAEEETVRQVAEWVRESNLQPDQIINNHIVFHYFYGSSGKERVERFAKINRNMTQPEAEKAASDLPAGSLFIWDSHYSYKVDSKGPKGLPMEYFKGNADFKPLYQLQSGDRRFGTIVFQKER